MSEKKQDDGGPAFPHLRRYVKPDVYQSISEGGISLRDKFAEAALIAMGTWCPGDGDLMALTGDDWHARRQELRAQHAYAQADAMLKARNGGNQ